jgi:hypothetical protein
MNKQLTEFNLALGSKKYSIREQKGLQEDLDAVYLRLLKHEYSRGSFSRNKFDIPDKVHEVYVNIEYYSQIGKVWEEILKKIRINNYHDIADICPGFSPKVELGLHFAGFQGDVYLIDKDKKSLIQLKHFLDLYNVKFKSTFLIQDIFGKRYRSFDLVTANHAMDDLTLNYFSGKFGINMKNIYENEGVLSDFWKKILNDKEKNLSEITAVIIRSFDKLVNPNGVICLFEYKSYAERMLDLRSEYVFTRQLFRKVVSALKTKGYRDFKINKSDISSSARSFHAWRLEILQKFI